LSKFERRIDEDIRNGALPREPSYYVHLLRNTWEEDRNACASHQPQRSGKDREGENEAASLDKSNYSGIGNASSSVGNGLQFSLLHPTASAFDITNDTVAEDSQVDFMSTDLWRSEKPRRSSSMSTTFYTDPLKALVEPLVSDSSFGYTDEQTSNTNTNATRNTLDQFCGCDYDSEGANFMSLASLPSAGGRNISLRDGLIPEPVDSDYFLGVGSIEGMLQIENQKPVAMAKGKNKFSGERRSKRR
jgi:hypothetical protein